MQTTIHIAAECDLDVMWHIFRAAASRGDTIPSMQDVDKATVHSQWLQPPVRSYLAVAKRQVLGMAKFGPNHVGRGAHVSTATFIVDPAFQGLGVGRSLLEHCLAEASRAGFHAMQFNYVVSSNGRAVRLYERFGFTIVGRIPRAFRHETLGFVDTLIMHRVLPAAGA